MTDADAHLRAFHEALRRLPPPISAFSNGVACPWCGELHRTITFGRNACRECARPFLFGAPPWADPDDSLVSWVDFPHAEFEALGGRADLLEPWEPTPALIALHRQKVKEAAERRGEEAPRDH